MTERETPRSEHKKSTWGALESAERIGRHIDLPLRPVEVTVRGRFQHSQSISCRNNRKPRLSYILEEVKGRERTTSFLRVVP